MSDIDFPTSTSELPGADTQSGNTSGGGSWPVEIKDVYTTFNQKYQGGKNGLMIEIETQKNHKVRQVFYPEGNSSRTKKLLQQLEKIGIGPSTIGGWKALRGYIVDWTSEDRTFETEENGAPRTVNYQLEYPVAVVMAPAASGAVQSGSGNGSDGAGPFDRLKLIGIGKTKSELKFAVSKDNVLSQDFGESIGSGKMISDLVDDGVWTIEGGKIQRGPNF